MLFGKTGGRKCKRGVNCFHISFREQMRREMHFTGTSTEGVSLAWCNVEHLFLFPEGCWIISKHGYCRGREEGGEGISVGEGRRSPLSPVLMMPAFLSLPHGPPPTLAQISPPCSPLILWLSPLVTHSA